MRRKPARRPRYRDHPRRRADGRHDRIVGATVVTLGLLTLPTLLRRKYDKASPAGSSAPPARWPNHPAESDPDPARRHPETSRSERYSRLR